MSKRIEDGGVACLWPLVELIGMTSLPEAPSVTHGGNTTYLVTDDRVFRWSEHERLYPVAGYRGTPRPGSRSEGDDAMAWRTPGPFGVVAAPDGSLVLRGNGGRQLWSLPRGGLRQTASGFVAVLPDANVRQFGPGGLPEAPRIQPEDQAALRFAHAPDGPIQSVTDAAGDVVRVQRLTETHVVFTAPFGEQTHLWDDDADGYVDRLEHADDPGGRGYEFTFGTADREGLLLSMVDRTGLGHAFDCDADGRLISDGVGSVPAQTLVRSAPENGERIEGTDAITYSSFHVDHYSPWPGSADDAPGAEPR